MTETPAMRRPAIHLLLSDGYLAVANHGRPFTWNGLQAACRIGQSSKETRIHRGFADRADAGYAVWAMHDQMLVAAMKAPEKIANNAINEEKICRRLTGKLIPELLINANDSIGKKQIGGKGMGLKAILAASDSPRIHSGLLSFGFDRTHSERAYQQSGVTSEHGRYPVMSLPISVAPEDEPEPVRQLIGNFDTVIVMPFRDERSRNATVAEWQNRIADINMVRKFPAVHTIVWERRDASETSKRTCLEQDSQTIRVFDEGRIVNHRPIKLRNPRRVRAGASPAADRA